MSVSPSRPRRAACERKLSFGWAGWCGDVSPARSVGRELITVQSSGPQPVGATDGEMSSSVRIPHTSLWPSLPSGHTGAGWEGCGQSGFWRLAVRQDVWPVVGGDLDGAVVCPGRGRVSSRDITGRAPCRRPGQFLVGPPRSSLEGTEQGRQRGCIRLGLRSEGSASTCSSKMSLCT